MHVSKPIHSLSKSPQHFTNSDEYTLRGACDLKTKIEHLGEIFLDSLKVGAKITLVFMVPHVRAFHYIVSFDKFNTIFCC